MKTKKAPVETPVTGLTVREFVAQLPESHTLSKVAKEAKVSLTSLSMHLRHPSVELSVKNAKKLEKWSGGRISAARTVGL